MKKYYLLLPLFFILLLSYFSLPQKEVQAFHSEAELKQFKINGLPLDSSRNSQFWASGKCEGCHGFDPDGIASVDADGNDINVMDDWRSSIMANSAKDPFWRAKVSHETLVNPSHAVGLEDKCTSCHAPLGHFAAKIDGASNYSMADLLADSTALDGVSCAACHEQSPDSIGKLFSGNMLFDTNNVIYGPYEKFVLGAPMLTYVEEPVFGAHIGDAGLCASCHTLITETVDLDGNYTGGEFVEQATYHEWLNSDFGRNNVTCQGCHMPQINDPVVIADGYATLVDFPKSPYGLHTLVGGNAFMLRLLKNNITELGLTASSDQFDETIMETYKLLTEQTLDLELLSAEIDDDSMYVDVKLINKAGHKFPSGYPSRRAFIEVLLFDESSDTIFKSGVLQSDYEVEGQDNDYEDHYDVINDPQQVQIYELVLGDVLGGVTTTLERAAFPLKDNRLTPLGFYTTDPAYDTTEIAGKALLDDDFNLNEFGEEGSGSDIVSYHMPLNGYEGEVSLSVRVYYQSMPPKWMDEMFSYSSPEIDSFRNMYFAEDNTPILIKSLSLDTVTDYGVGIEAIRKVPSFTITPNPATDYINVSGDLNSIEKAYLVDAIGRTYPIELANLNQYKLPDATGVYHLIIELTDGRMSSVKVLKQ